MSKLFKKIVAIVALFSILCYTMPVFAVMNEESVFTKMNPNGTQYKTIVSNKTDEKVNQYNTNDILPIETKVIYSLNGKEILPEELVGKSGHVDIKIEYKNNSSKIFVIDGKSSEIFTPFVVITGALIDNKNNTNIAISNGKAIENGNKTIVVAYSMPGLSESLNLNNSLIDIDIPDSVHLSMDTEKFEMNNIMTFSTPKLLDKSIDWTKLNQLFDSGAQLKLAADELENGTSQLVQGIDEDLIQGVKQLDSGATQLEEGSKRLSDGTEELYNTVVEKISSLKDIESKYTNKEYLAEEISKIVNEEMQKLMPELLEMAKEEASSVVRSHKDELEDMTVNTAMNLTDKIIDNKVEELKLGKLSIPSDLENSLKNDLNQVVQEIINDTQVQAFKRMVKESIVEELKATIKPATESAANSILEQMSSNGASNTTKEQIANAVTNIVTLSKGTIDASTAQGIVMNIMDTTKNEVISGISSQIDTISDLAVDNTISQIELTSVDKSVEQFVVNVKTSLAVKLGGLESLQAIENNLKNQLIDNLMIKLKQDNVVGQYLNQMEQELRQSINEVANITARELAQRYTEKLANEIVNNLLQKQLAGQISNEVIENEVLKYETQFKEKIYEIDQIIDTAQNAIYQINDGSKALYEGTKQLSNGTHILLDGTYTLLNGANELNNGMTQFNREGISKLYNIINGDLYNLKQRGVRLEQLSKDYYFDNKSADIIKFISVMDSIKLNEKEITNEDVIVSDNNVSIKDNK